MFEFKSRRAICTILTITFASVCCEVLREPATVVDTFISDRFEATEKLWDLVVKDEPNVLDDITKLFRDIPVTKIFSWQLLNVNIFRIKHYGDLISNATRSSQHGIVHKSINTIDDLNNEITTTTTDTAMLFNITSLDEFWQVAVQNSTVSKSPCLVRKKFASQQMLVAVYRKLQMAYLKNYLRHQQLCMTANLKFKDENVNFRALSQQTTEKFQQIFSSLRTIAKKYFSQASTDIFVCQDFESRVNYTTVTNFLQGFIDNEANLNQRNSCSSECSDYKNTKHLQCQPHSICGSGEGNNPKLRCNGAVRDCREVDTTSFSSVFARDAVLCVNNEDPTRRYDSIIVNGKSIAGRNNAWCQESVDHAVNANSWWSGLYRCTNCYCYCDDDGSNSERHFSLRDVVSNIKENRVITDVRMNNINGVIQFEIKERFLLPFADTSEKERLPPPLREEEVSGSAIGWLSAPAFSVQNPNVEKNVDFYELTYEKRSMNLDEVKLPTGHVLTGIRFSVKDDRLTIEARGTEFDYGTGVLKNLEDSKWYSSVNGLNEIHFAPVKTARSDTQQYPEIHSLTNAFVTFGPSDFSTDIGQTTIPFIEVHSAESEYSGALAGVGLVYKTTKDEATFNGDYVLSGHYISTKTIAYDVEPHF